MAGKLCAFIMDGRECRREMTAESGGDLIALRNFRCPLGHRSFETATGTDIRFRRTFNGETWHFSKDCSQWPVTNFSSVSYVSGEATIRSECLAQRSLTP